MANLYGEVKSWKKPIHVSRTILAKNYVNILRNVEVIGVTGSVGKTLTQSAIYKVLSQKFRTVVGDENLDPTFRIPITILSAKPWDQKMILEYGIEHPGDMDEYLKIVIPKIGVVTKITPTHTKYFGNQEGVFEEKSKLIKALPKNGHAVLNFADPYLRRLKGETKAKIWWFGEGAKDGVKISHFSQNFSGSKFRLHFRGAKATVNWKIVGRHYLLSAYAAATVGLICGLTLKQIAKGLSGVKVPEHRLNLIPAKNFTMLDDTYNSSPKAAEASIDTLLSLGKGFKKAVVLGDMKDLGKLSKGAHEKLGEKIAKSKINFLVTVGKTAQIVAISAKNQGFGGEIIEARDTKEASLELRKKLKSKALVLVKGSRHAHLERVVLALCGKPTEINCYHCGLLS